MPDKREDSVFVQESTLEKLKCFSCQNYLSILPIYITSAGNPICGRCPISEADVQRNTLYENAIEYQKFPCVNCDTGCLETGIPSKMAKHEKICEYTKHECLTRKYTEGCNWEGHLTEMLDHFEMTHPTFLLKSGSFEVNLANNHMKDYLMSIEDDLYVVTIEANSKDTTFATKIVPLNQNLEGTAMGMYELTLENENKAYKCTMRQSIGERLEVLGGNISRILSNGPTTIRAHIQIDKKASPLRSLSSKSDEELADHNAVNYDELVECPVCLHYIVSPIFQCSTGHNICEGCMATQESCPRCSKAFTGTRNFSLETLMEKRMYPCRHKGCKYQSLGANIKKHEVGCVHGLFQCPLRQYSNCVHSFPLFKLFHHIRYLHNKNLIELDTISFPWRYGNIVETYILKRHRMLFKLCFKQEENKKNDDILFWELQLIGPDEQRLKYYFQFEVIDNTGNNHKLLTTRDCAPFVDKAQTFSNAEYYIMFHWSLLEPFVDEEKFTCRIIIKKKI